MKENGNWSITIDVRIVIGSKNMGNKASFLNVEKRGKENKLKNYNNYILNGQKYYQSPKHLQ